MQSEIPHLLRAGPSRPVVILNMHYTGLAIARGLHGCAASPVYGMGPDEELFGNRSRYCRYLRCPDTERAPEECRDFLMDFARQFDTAPLLFPTRDHDLQFLARFYDDLSERYLLVAAPPPLLQAILNKASLYRVACDLGIPCPPTVWVSDRADMERAGEELAFPVIAKPIYTTQWRRKEVWDIVGRQKAAVLRDRDELRRFYARLESVDPLMHVQEFVPGADTELVVFGSYASVSGPLRYFTGRKRLQYPPRSGTGVAVEACPVPDIVAPSQSLIRGLGYSGASEIEYKRDPRTGAYVLIEMNPRFWDQHGLGAAVGVNLVQCLFLDLTGSPLPPDTPATGRMTWIAEEGCIAALASTFRNRDYRAREVLRALKGQRTLAVFRRDDVRPAMAVARRVVGQLVRSAMQRGAGRETHGRARAT